MHSSALRSLLTASGESHRCLCLHFALDQQRDMSKRTYHFSPPGHHLYASGHSGLDKQTPQADGHPQRLPLTPPSDPSSPRLRGQPPTTSVLRQETRHMEAGVCIRSMEISARASIRSSGNSSSCGKKHTDVWTGSPRTGRPDPGSVRGRPDRMWLRGCDLLRVDALFVVSGEQDNSNGYTSHDNCCA